MGGTNGRNAAAEAAVLAATAAAFRASEKTPSFVVLLYPDGTYSMPHPVQLAPAAPGKPERSGCRAEILRTLRAVGHRLVTTELLGEMERRGFAWSESTARAALAALVEDGELDNDQKANPRGYGFPEWSMAAD